MKLPATVRAPSTTAARKASPGDPLFSSEASDTFRELLDSRYADLVADSGTLGLARQIERQVAALQPVNPGGKG